MTKGTKVKFPTDLFSFDPDPSIMTPGNDQYGGADISLATDGQGNEYVAFTARELSSGAFGFVIWDLTRNRKVPYAPFCNARGEINNSGKWIAWNNKDFYKGQIPGYAPYPNLAAEIAALRAQIAALEARPAGGALSERHTKALEALCRLMGL